MNPHSYANLILDKGAKKDRMEKRQPLQQYYWEKWQSAS
jgi:hypothetical protein